MGAVAIGVGSGACGRQFAQALLELAAVDAPLGGRRVVLALVPTITGQVAADLHNVHCGDDTGFPIAVEKILVTVVDPRIEDGDAHPPAVQRAAARYDGHGRAGTRDGLQQAAVAGGGAVRCDANDVFAYGQCIQGTQGHHGGQGAHRQIVVKHRAATGQDVLAQEFQRWIGAVGVDQHLHMVYFAELLAPGYFGCGIPGGYRTCIVPQVAGNLGAWGRLGHCQVTHAGQGGAAQRCQAHTLDERPSCTHRRTPCS